jgi:hypothetical protein
MTLPIDNAINLADAVAHQHGVCPIRTFVKREASEQFKAARKEWINLLFKRGWTMSEIIEVTQWNYQFINKQL